MTKSFDDLKNSMPEERLKKIKERLGDIYLTLDRSGTPCQGMCSTIYGDDFCLGCGRHYQEVIDWNVNLTLSEKADIVSRYKELEEFFKNDVL